jgi:hypothetical protein
MAWKTLMLMDKVSSTKDNDKHIKVLTNNTKTQRKANSHLA